MNTELEIERPGVIAKNDLTDLFTVPIHEQG